MSICYSNCYIPLNRAVITKYWHQKNATVCCATFRCRWLAAGERRRILTGTWLHQCNADVQRFPVACVSGARQPLGDSAEIGDATVRISATDNVRQSPWPWPRGLTSTADDRLWRSLDRAIKRRRALRAITIPHWENNRYSLLPKEEIERFYTADRLATRMRYLRTHRWLVTL